MLSVIVPVYNVEKYLRRCLESLVNQTYRDIEIICINDGSTDNSPKILEEYSKKSDKIIILDKTNGGLSSARNLGLSCAKGQYVAFVDSDDWVDFNYYEKLIKAIEKHNADAAFTSYVRKSKTKHKERIRIEEEKVYSNIKDKIRVTDSLKNPCVWNKVYKKDILIKNNLFFKEVRYYEDALFTIPFLNLCDKLVSVPDAYYYYFVNPSSIVKSGKTQHKIADRMMARLNLLKYLNDNKIFIEPKALLTCQYKIQLFALTLWVKKQDQYMDRYYLFGAIPIYTKYSNNASIVELRGRMANQMFIWAFAKKLEKQSRLPVLIDDSATTPKLQPFNCFREYKAKVAPKNPFKMFLRKIIPFRKIRDKITKEKFNLPVIEEKNFHEFEQNLLNTETPSYFGGYYQSEKYFADLRDEILEDFRLNIPLNAQNKKMLEKIKGCEAISLHVRRTDYLKRLDTYGTCSVEYYKNAIDYTVKKADIKKPVIFIFSDDYKWCKKHLKFPYQTVYANINSSNKGYFDLELMKNCKHNVIANSSFSWWGAWLNENPDKIVIAPKPWFKHLKTDGDLIPEIWVQMEA